jgi:hypothetical protein
MKGDSYDITPSIFCEACDREIVTNDDKDEMVQNDDGFTFCSSDCLHEWDFESDQFKEPFEEDLSDFAHPGGVSALRAATPDNPRIHPCPTCKTPNALTAKDVALHYQCDRCSDHA